MRQSCDEKEKRFALILRDARFFAPRDEPIGIRKRPAFAVIEPAGRDIHAGLLRQAFALRHRTFVECRGWDELRRDDGLDRDR